MDSTLDSIRPSDTVNNQEDMSYLFGRDPSILAYGQRPCPAKETKKNLLSLYENEEYDTVEESQESTTSESKAFQTVKVYLRLKPFPRKMKISDEQKEAYQITNSTTLSTRLPILDNTTSSFKRSKSDVVYKKFTFTQTFGPEVSQLELFEQTVKQQMTDFLNGKNCTVMTYGTTSSGKSYTLQGTTLSPGIIPRSLEFVFSNITPKPMPSYKPIHHCDVVTIESSERAHELETKTKLLTFGSVDKSQYINAYKQMQKLLQEESPIRPSQCNDAFYSVWVSFAEIYNETVYDLLSNDCQKKRPPLKLATDNQGRAFIRGLKTVCVNSGSEAYQVLMAGQYNLKVAATALNAKSSRSHCIFTIRLLKYYTENAPESVEVSTFAFCDLAGSERLKKTLNIGDRLKEAQNINTSLLVLGRCLKSIHEGQLSNNKNKTDPVGPFRESKLTRLFQRALSGKEHIALIVNVNPLPNLYVETQNVLSFSAIAKKIVIEQQERKQKKSKSRFSLIVAQSVKTVTDWDATELESEEWQSTEAEAYNNEFIHPEDYDDVVAENEKLKREIASLKSLALTRDLQIRQEMADTYTAMMKELEADWKNRIRDVEEQQEDALEWSVRQVEEFYKQKLDQLNSRKRRRSYKSDDNSNGEENEYKACAKELEIENTRLTSKLVALKTTVKDLRETNHTLSKDKNAIAFELTLAKDDLACVKNLLEASQKDICGSEEANSYIESLKSQLFAKQEQIKKLKQFLEEAKQEYIDITTDAREKEIRLKEQEEIIIENEERIDELESHLEHANLCAVEKTKAAEMLEDRLESQSKKILSAELKVQQMRDKVAELEGEKSLLEKKVESLQDEIDNASKNQADNNNLLKLIESPLNVTEYQEIVIKEEVVTEENAGTSNKSMESVEKAREREMEEKISMIQTENETLKEKLGHSTVEIESLKEALESAKLKLNCIFEQVNSMKSSQRDVKNLSTECEEINDASAKTEGELVETECKGSQTDSVFTKDGINQTSFIEASATEISVQTDDVSNDADASTNVQKELADAQTKYAEIEEKYKQECSRVEEVTEELTRMQKQIDILTEKTDSNNVVIDEYQSSVELLKEELAVVTEESKKAKEELVRVGDIRDTLETKVEDYKQLLNELQNKLASVKDNNARYLEKLAKTQEDLQNHVLKCVHEHDPRIQELEELLSEEKDCNQMKTQCIDAHAEKISQLERNLEEMKKLENKIAEYDRNLETCQAEKDKLQKLLEDNNERIRELEDQVEQATGREQDKDVEIAMLQKEMKKMIQTTENDEKSGKVMEKDMKKTLKELAQTQEALSHKQEQVENLERRVQTFEQNVKVLELLQQSAHERQAENERLRIVNDELKNNLIQKEREMESFMKNRDETVTKYESLVKSQQEEVDRQKREVMRYQELFRRQTTPTPKKEETRKLHHRIEELQNRLRKYETLREKDPAENTSEDEVMTSERLKRRGKKDASPPGQQEIAVIDLSESESRRKTRRTALPPPSAEIPTEKKKNRKKKLFALDDELYQDIETIENTIPSTPHTQTRSLRTRRK